MLIVVFMNLDPNIDVNYRCNGWSAIFHCSTVSILKLLLSHKNIDVNVQDKTGCTVLHILCYDTCRAYSNKTILHYLCCYTCHVYAKKIKIIKELLLDGRINLSIEDIYGKTALEYAIHFKNDYIAKIIRKKNRECKIISRKMIRISYFINIIK